jgi:hypothetical protein
LLFGICSLLGLFQNSTFTLLLQLSTVISANLCIDQDFAEVNHDNPIENRQV